MRKAFVHVGMPKTGTTAIQQSLSRHRATLRQDSLIYPGRDVDHAFLVQRFHPVGGRHFYFRNQGIEPEKAGKLFDTAFKQMRWEVESSDGDILLSSEYLFDIGEVGIRALQKSLAEMGLDMHVVCYVRHPISQAASGIQQNIKMGHGVLTKQLQNPQWHSFVETIAPALRVLGKHRVIVASFAAGRELGTERHILKLIGHDALVDLIPRADANVGLSGAAVVLADAHNRLLQKYPKFPAAKGYLFRIGGPSFSLPVWTIQKMRARVDEELAWLEENFSLTLPEPEPRPFKVQRLSEKAAEDIVKMIMQSETGKY